MRLPHWLMDWLFSSMFLNFQVCGDLLNFSCLPLWSENVHCLISVLCNLLRFVFLVQDIVYLGECSMGIWKKCMFSYLFLTLPSLTGIPPTSFRATLSLLPTPSIPFGSYSLLVCVASLTIAFFLFLFLPLWILDFP